MHLIDLGGRCIVSALALNAFTLMLAQDYPGCFTEDYASWDFPDLACFFNPDFSGKLRFLHEFHSHLLYQLSYRGKYNCLFKVKELYSNKAKSQLPISAKLSI